MAKASAKVFALLPRIAAAYREKVARGLDGNPREVLAAKVILRQLIVDGRVNLRPEPDASPARV